MQALERLKRNSPTAFQAEHVDDKNEANEPIGRNNRNSTESKQQSHRQPASRSSSLQQPASAFEIDIEIDKDDIRGIQSTTDVYYNNSFALQKAKVSVYGLVEYVDSLSQDEIRSAFEKFPQGLIKPYVHSQRSENMPRNRYNGNYPYDDCRVKIRDGDTDFINASFIDGYKKRKEYIATLGPM
ncbi:PTPRT-like protein [Mya arenaria]|uniref:PTPRT-like protein n=1 Tax=Mya arenaria TaxID=6604 RepID=A0ABY7F4E4_MYAAR|nr:PTPRT-like protein [Mya arenaria]